MTGSAISALFLRARSANDQVDLVVKVPNVSNDRNVLFLLHAVQSDDVEVTR